MHVTTDCTVKLYFMCVRVFVLVCVHTWVQKLSKRKNIYYTKKLNVSGTTRREKTGDEWQGEGVGGGDGWSSLLQVLAALQFAALLPVRGGRHTDVHHIVPRRLVMSWSISNLLLWYDAIDLCNTEQRNSFYCSITDIVFSQSSTRIFHICRSSELVKVVLATVKCP